MLNYISLEKTPILEQLHLEEALLRADARNFCIVNQGAPPAIVMGISGNPIQLIDPIKHKQDPIPLIRRYSGGGTVVIEPTTILISFILNHDFLPVKPFPKDVLEWTTSLYKPLFPDLPFNLSENDYALCDKKCGGNAQYFTKNRIVHHTSFLFDYSKEHMGRLLLPPKMPAYRKGRAHDDFLAPLNQHFNSPERFIEQFMDEMKKVFKLEILDEKDVLQVKTLPHRKSSEEVEF